MDIIVGSLEAFHQCIGWFVRWIDIILAVAFVSAIVVPLIGNHVGRNKRKI
jgi:hypothetical protein